MELDDKKYGEISHSELTKFQDKFNSLKTETIGFQKDLCKIKDPEKWNQIFPPSSNWTNIYLLSYPEHVCTLFHVMGVLEPILAISKTDQTKSKKDVIDFLESMGDFDEDDLPEDQSLASVILVFIPLIKTLRSWMNYGKTLSTLVQEVQMGSDSSLFKAVRVDRAIISCPPIAHRIAIAELKGETRFFTKLQKSLSGKLRVKQNFDTLRFLLIALNDAGGLQGLSGDEKFNLFCKELKVYPDRESDSADALRVFVSRWIRDAESFVT